MATIRARVENLEKVGNTGKLKEAVYCVCLPATDDAEFQRVQEDIIKHRAAEQKVIMFEVIDVSG